MLEKNIKKPFQAGSQNRRKKRVTIADIARRAGVSPTTVSVTLTGRRDIAIPDETRDHVKRCAQALGYSPSRLGEGFFRGRSRLIGVLVMADSYLPFLPCIAGIQKALASADCMPLVLTSNWLEGYAGGNFIHDWHCAEGLPGLSRLMEYQVEGILYFSRNETYTAACIQEISRQRIPMVVLGGVTPPEARGLSGVDIVGGDNAAIGRLAAEHLLSLGRRSFAFGMPTSSHPLDDAVASSFIERIQSAGHDCAAFRVDMFKDGDLGPILSRHLTPPAGFFSAHDEIAALALRAALDRGWAVPGDLAVVGMGRTSLAKFSALPISTVNRNSFEVGETAANLLIQRIEGLGGPPRQVLIPPSLKIRPSSLSDVSWKLEEARSMFEFFEFS